MNGTIKATFHICLHPGDTKVLKLSLMLDIISMIIILFFLMGLPMILIIIGGSKSKSEQERTYELEEEAQYWRDYKKEQIRKKKIRKIKIRRFFKWVKNFIHGNK